MEIGITQEVADPLPASQGSVRSFLTTWYMVRGKKLLVGFPTFFCPPPILRIFLFGKPSHVFLLTICRGCATAIATILFKRVLSSYRALIFYGSPAPLKVSNTQEEAF